MAHLDVILVHIGFGRTAGIGECLADLGWNAFGEDVAQTGVCPFQPVPGRAERILFLEGIVGEVEDRDEGHLVGEQVV